MFSVETAMKGVLVPVKIKIPLTVITEMIITITMSNNVFFTLDQPVIINDLSRMPFFSSVLITSFV